MSQLEETFLDAWREHGIDIEPKRQFTIEGVCSEKDGRLLKFDFAFPEHRILIELDGFGYRGKGGGHQTQAGMEANYRKRRHAQLLGWRVIWYCSGCLKSKERLRDAIHEVMYLMADSGVVHAKRKVSSKFLRTKRSVP